MESPLALLLVEDDIDLRNELKDFMENFFEIIDVSDNIKDAYEFYKSNKYALVLTDIQLPTQDGLVLVNQIRKINPEQLIIVMSAYKETEYFLKSIELHIFRFLVKPFSSEQLMESIFEVTKIIKDTSNKEHENTWLQLSPNITYNLQTKYLYIDGEMAILTQKEEKLLNILVKNIDGHVSDTQLKNEIWDDENVADSTIRVLIKRLRTKLDYEDAIISLKGRGYKLTLDKTS